MILCSFKIAYQYPVHFTRGAFVLSNPLVREFLSEHGTQQMFVAIEETLVLKNPTLPQAVTDYLTQSGIPHSISILPGGEPSKKDDEVVKLERATERRQRQCFVVLAREHVGAVADGGVAQFWGGAVNV